MVLSVSVGLWGGGVAHKTPPYIPWNFGTFLFFIKINLIFY